MMMVFRSETTVERLAKEVSLVNYQSSCWVFERSAECADKAVDDLSAGRLDGVCSRADRGFL